MNTSKEAKYLRGSCKKIIHLCERNMIQAILPNKSKVLVLYDAGCTESLISATTIDKSAYLSSLKPIPVRETKYQIGNGSYIVSKYAIRVELSMQGHAFEVLCHIVPNLGGMDILFSNKSMSDLSGVLDFENHTVHFKTKSILLRPNQTSNLKTR